MYCPGITTKEENGCWSRIFPWDLSKEEKNAKVIEIMGVLHGMSVASARKILFDALRVVEGVKLDLVKFTD